MSNQPASDRALRDALSLPAVNGGASRARKVKVSDKHGDELTPLLDKAVCPCQQTPSSFALSANASRSSFIELVAISCSHAHCMILMLTPVPPGNQ